VDKDYWERNGLTKPQEYIVCAACVYQDIMIVGPRHFDSVMRSQLSLMSNKPKAGTQWKQGFINQWGEFRDREKALIIVKASGQPFDAKRNGGNGEELYSEGIY